MKKNKVIAAIILASCLALPLALSACAPQTRELGSAPEPDDATTVAIVWSPDSDCAICHVAEQSSYDDTACGASQHQEQICESCHDDEATLSTVHEGKTGSDKMPKRLKETEVAEDTCLSCHFNTREELAAATADVVLSDAKGTSVNPHQLPQGESHDSIRCGDCHGMHDGEALLEKANGECASCHHSGVFECYTCHG